MTIRSTRRAARGWAALAAVALLTGGCNLARATVSPTAAPAVSSTPSPERTGPADQRPAPSPDPSPLRGVDEVTVESVTDGDTIVVSGGIRVRLIGMDTPETRHPDRGVECFGPEASARTAELLSPGEPVRLVYDVDRADRYERTLAYVYRSSDGLFVNAVLVAEGYARAGTYPPNVAHDAEFRRLEDEARSAGRGLWTACAVGGAPPSQPNRAIPPLALARPTTATLTAWAARTP